MKYTQVAGLLAISVFPLIMSGPVTAAPRACTDAETKDLVRPAIRFGPDDDGILKRFSRGELPLEGHFDVPVLSYPYGALDLYGSNLTVVVDTQGRVDCASLKAIYGSSLTDDNPVRRAFLEQVEDWDFDPYVVDGVAVPAMVEFRIHEEEKPAVHVEMPQGDLAQVMISQDNHPWMANFNAYQVELHGDGTAIYMSWDPDDPLGPQTYHVDPKAVQALATKAKDADFWSLRDAYGPPSNSLGDGESFQRINLTLGGKTKSLTDSSGDDAGMPAAINVLESATFSAANVFFWQRPTLATLDQLKANAYNFQSKRAGRLLLEMTQNSEVHDDAILALMELGAPQDAMRSNRWNSEYQNLLEAALGNGRTTISAKLIAGGALLTDGNLDHEKVDWAFIQAVLSANIEAVDQILPFHPSLTYPDPTSDDDVRVSIIRKLGDVRFGGKGAAVVAQRLIDLGADVNTRLSDGTTLLHEMFIDEGFVAFLLDHGADVNALDNKGVAPLAHALDEDTALLMLEHGGDPRLGLSSRNLRFNIVNNRWLRAKAWLTTHGFADVLVSPPGEKL